METETFTIEQFISKYNLKFKCHRVESRPDSTSEWDATARHFRCRISTASKLEQVRQARNIANAAYVANQRLGMSPKEARNAGKTWVEASPARSFGLYFSQGSAHTSDPTLADVLDCLAMDANGYENTAGMNTNKLAQFCGWCVEYGYDTDSRRAEKIYKTVKRQAEQLKRTLGAEAYEELLWQVERL